MRRAAPSSREWTLTSHDDLVVTADESSKESEAKGTSNPATGAGGVENVIGTVKAIQNGDWDTAGLSALGAGIDMVGLAADPLSTLAGWGVGWLIENVSFLRTPFDMLMGNPDAINGMASTWENIGKEVKATAQDYRKAAQNTTDWEGVSAEVYRNLGNNTSEHIDTVGQACDGVKAAVTGAGVVVGAVRGIVRDMIAMAVGEIIGAVLKWGLAAAATAGIAAGGLVADAVRIALKWADKISEWMNKLSSALKNLSKVLDKFGSAGKSLRTKVDEFFNGLANPPAAHMVKLRQQPTLNSRNIEELASKSPHSKTQSVDNAATNAPPKTNQTNNNATTDTPTETKTNQTNDNATTDTEKSTRLKDAWEGLKKGGAEYKPFASGDLRPDKFIDMGPHFGAEKFGYEVVKGLAATDDGRDLAAERKEENK